MIVDCNATLGRWPYRRLRHASPLGYLALMGEEGLEQAWVAAFEALLYSAMEEANQLLAQQVAGLEDRLMPLGMIRPNYPGWEDDLEGCVDRDWKGIRLYPSYHGYSLDDPEARRLLKRAAQAGLMVQIATRMQDERHQHHLGRVDPVDLRPLATVCRQLSSMPVVILNAGLGELAPLAEDGWPANLYADISHVDGLNAVGRLAELIGVEHVLFGTHGPLLIVRSAVLKVKECDLSEEERRLVMWENAQRLLSGLK